MMWTINKCEGDHHWCQWSPRYPSTIYWVWIDVLMSNTQLILSIKGQWCEPMSREREYVINAYKYQGTKLFLRLIHGWWSEVDRNSLVEGGPWWIPHRRHETQKKVMEFGVWCNHRTESKGTDTKHFFTIEINSQYDFPLNIERHDRRLGIID